MGKNKKKKRKHGGSKSTPPPGVSAESGVEQEADGAEEERDEGEEEAAAEGAPDAATEAAPAAARQEPEPAPAPPAPPADDEVPPGEAWSHPVWRFERAWTKLDTKLITFVLIWQVLALVAWVFLAGMSSPVASADKAGIAFRAGIGAIALGLAGWLLAPRAGVTAERPRTWITLGGVVVGLALAPAWRGLGVDYFDNVKGWLQEGSTLTLLGGLRGLVTRLTLWLALLGASLATAMGKHIHVDVVLRFLPKRLRIPAACTTYAATALVCFAGVWGFFDHIALSVGSKLEDRPGAKIAHVAHELGTQAFLTRKQIGLDLKTLPHVLSGERYDRWMSAREWNAWVKDAGFEARYPKEQVQSLVIPDDDPPHAPMVLAPDGEATRGMLVHTLNLVFPFGLLVIGIRFLLRILLAIGGNLNLDPDAAHAEGEPTKSAEPAEEQA